MPPPGQVPRLDRDAAPGLVGFQFPADYRVFVDLYGQGSVGDGLGIVTPHWHGGRSGATNGFEAMTAYTEHEIGLGMRSMREQWPDAFPFSFHPEPEGNACLGPEPERGRVLLADERPGPGCLAGVGLGAWQAQLARAWSRYDHGMTGIIHDAVTGVEPLCVLVASADHRTWFAHRPHPPRDE